MSEHDLLDPSLNVVGEALQVCSLHPQTGFFRDGHCNTGPQDFGLHGVCVVVDEAFLAFSSYTGNALSTPMPEPQNPKTPKPQNPNLLNKYARPHFQEEYILAGEEG